MEEVFCSDERDGGGGGTRSCSVAAIAALMEQMQQNHTEVLNILNNQSQQMVELFEEQKRLSALLSTGGGVMLNSSTTMESREKLLMSSSNSNSNSNSSSMLDQDKIPKYAMSRVVSSLMDLWTEWHVGLGSNPSVKSLEQTYGAKWRKEPKETKYFHRRKKIVDAIKAYMEENHVELEVAIQHFNDKKGNRSLNWLTHQI